MVKKPIIGITVGDPSGIGAEITVKALNLQDIYDICSPLVISDAQLIRQAIRIIGSDLKVNVVNDPGEGLYELGLIDVLDMKNIDMTKLEYGKVTVAGGDASFQYIVKSIELALSGEIDAITTGPIHKKAIDLAGHHYSGHTEIFSKLTNTKDYCMMLIDKEFRVSHVSTHIALNQVSSMVKKSRVLKVIELTHQALINMGILNPRLAVAGLNPHSGEDGLFGTEEIEEIRPAIEEAVRLGMQVEGPIPPDTIFVNLKGGKYDAVVAMYHDQGHIPIKLVGFKYDPSTNKMASVAGVNVTLGLPIIRTSVDHGVAFNSAGKGTANPESMIDALRLASIMAK